MYPIPQNIILTDDDEDDRLFFVEAFQEIKIESTLTTFNNGELLIEYLHDEHNTLPDIIFLDLNMPKKSGFECLNEIRRNNRLKNISVAIYSTSSSKQDIENSFIAGANVYINKPSDFFILKKVLNNVILTNWQYIIDGLDKNSFILKL